MDELINDEDDHATEWWWIDYLENEMEPGLEKDLQALLQCSQEDRDTFEQFRVLREWLRAADPAAHLPLDNRLERLRREVMHSIEQLDTAKDAVDSGNNYLPGTNEDTKALSV
jgi:hypothetical protein